MIWNYWSSLTVYIYNVDIVSSCSFRFFCRQNSIHSKFGYQFSGGANYFCSLCGRFVRFWLPCVGVRACGLRFDFNFCDDSCLFSSKFHVVNLASWKQLRLIWLFWCMVLFYCSDLLKTLKVAKGEYAYAYASMYIYVFMYLCMHVCMYSLKYFRLFFCLNKSPE